MSFIERLFGKKNNEVKKVINQNKSKEYLSLLSLNAYFIDLFNGSNYIAKSDYLVAIKEHKESIIFFKSLKESGMLDKYCQDTDSHKEIILRVVNVYEHIEQEVHNCNEAYVKKQMELEKNYLDTILSPIDSKIVLDEEQRRVVLADEDYSLVIAGAGAGKTTTVAAKVKYLVEKRNIHPMQILIISFTNKAVNELKQRINKELSIPAPIATFHSTGNAIIHKNEPDEKLNIVDESKLYFVLRDYFRNSILQNENTVNSLIMFFASYFDAPYEGEDLNKFFHQIAKGNFSTMRSELDEFQRELLDKKNKKMVTIQNEILRSREEVEIANFFYLNNIDYEYEPIYPYDLRESRKPYTPDFIIKQGEKEIYVEHFGITEWGENNRYTKEELERYKQAINQKILHHKRHNTILIYTFSVYQDEKPMIEHLKEKLLQQGFILTPKSNEEVLKKLVMEAENRYVRRLINLVCRFISNFKVNGYGEEDFTRMYHATDNVRTKLFLDICSSCYLEYQKYLKEHNAVDFQDLINDSTRILQEVKEMKQKLDFKYIIVDEYQDISRQRFDLTKILSEVTKAKIMAVGDDWQSIYAFSGSDITLFTKFQEKVGYAKLLKIVQTYRNSQEIIDIAGHFIQKNEEQITKSLESSKHIENPVFIYTYDSTCKRNSRDKKSGVNYAIARVVEAAIEQIIAYNEKEGSVQGNILLLGRYSFDGDHLERSGLFEYKRNASKIKSVKYPKLDITFMTVHTAKGLGYDDVIVLNGKNGIYGFPSKIEDDPVLSLVLKEDRAIDYAEERRLFYVAMTRTKGRVYFIAPEQNPSEFLLEIKKEYKNVILRGKWNEEPSIAIDKNICPICGYPMQHKYKNGYGLRLYICTNEPEICGFMTNEYKAGKLGIMKCNQCRDGYLIVKKGKCAEYFTGCSNYKEDKTGCGKMLSRNEYYQMYGYAIEELLSKEKEKSEEKKKVKMVYGEPIIEKEHIVQPIMKKQIKKVLYQEKDLNDILVIILKALVHISEYRYYGVSMLADIVKGSKNKRITETKLNHIPEYGALAKLHREDIIYIIEWMIKNEFILQTKALYPVLHPTHRGMNYKDNISEVKLKQLKRYLEKES